MEEVKGFMSKWDRNNDGRIDFDEFCAVLSKTQKAWDDQLRVAFEVFDVDGDGKISSSDIVQMLKEMGQSLTSNELELIMSEVDTNKSGHIEFDEFKQMMTYGQKGPTS
eukprot:c6635_g1_i2.p1 GENE.c6635_g1_i2~~c6635_g1_i2.p1  ORF type:complete len:109 (+),score=38.04 c6635_g1_i2:255-581(+)